jgi:hypothetical protein
MVEYGEDYTDAATVIEGMKTAYTVGRGYAKEVVEPEGAEVLEADAEAKEGDVEAKDADAEKDGQQNEKEHADDLADQPDQAKARETDEASDADARLTQQNDAETAVMQDELIKILDKNQMILDEFGEKQAEFAGSAPASLEKGAADIKALQAPVGGQAQMKETTNNGEKTAQNHIPAWRPARMDFRKK